MIYEPREDSYLIEKYVRVYAKGNVLDVGCGSGILSLAASECEKIVGVDINPECVEYCKEHIKGEFFVSDLFSNVEGVFDLIIFNPPYLPEDPEEDSESAIITTGGKNGYEIIERFFREVKKYLKTNGKILIVVSSLTGNVEEIFTKNGFNFKVLEREKIFFEELIVYVLDLRSA